MLAWDKLKEQVGEACLTVPGLPHWSPLSLQQLALPTLMFSTLDDTSVWNVPP